MSPTQQKILDALMGADGAYVSTGLLIDIVWPPEGHGNPNNLRAQIFNLRRQMTAKGEFVIETKIGRRSAGYRLVKRDISQPGSPP
jgi:DNA-binding winged helix-turn-helix (wHTH) protein